MAGEIIIVMKEYTFKKEERLCSKRDIDFLFHNGSSFVVYPFRVVYAFNPSTSPFPVQSIISVSKRRFKHAVDRNRVKRLMRECYRLEKGNLYVHLNNHTKYLFLAIQYIGQDILPYQELKNAMRKLIIKTIHETAEPNLVKTD